MSIWTANRSFACLSVVVGKIDFTANRTVWIHCFLPGVRFVVALMKTNTARTAGFTLTEILIVVGIIGFISAIAIPNFLKNRATAQKNSCVANLRQIDGAVQQWVLVNNKAPTDTYSLSDTLIRSYMKGSVFPLCPGGGTYTPGATVSVLTTCTLNSLGHTL